jgi:hypothetical protein
VSYRLQTFSLNFLAKDIHLFVFCCLEQMGYSRRFNAGDIDTILPLLWAEKTRATLAITFVQQS